MIAGQQNILAFESVEVAQLWVDLMMDFDDDFYRSGTVTETDGVQVVFVDMFDRPVTYSAPMGILQWAQLSQLPRLVEAGMAIINGGSQ